jgi:hypothetical protein
MTSLVARPKDLSGRRHWSKRNTKKIGTSSPEIAPSVHLFARIESKIPKDRSEIPPSVHLFARTENKIPNDRSEIGKVETELGKSERRKSSCWVKDRRHCSQIQIKNEAIGSKTGGTEIRTDHHARTKTSDRRVTAGVQPKKRGSRAMKIGKTNCCN